MSKIRSPELEERLSGSDRPVVLDIRPRKDYQREHIEGSRNLAVYGDLRSGDTDALREKLDNVPSDRDVVTVCKAGVVAKKATAVLEGEGYDAQTLAGGMRGWNGYQNGTIGYRLSAAVRSLLP
ncbi:rhodanese-like domain-containing protein [Natrialbaceae archaeon A-gly3]